MRRRTVLTGVGASVVPLTGCTGFGAEGDRGSPAGTATPLTHCGRRELQVSSVDPVPPDVPLEPSVTVTHSSVTADRPARIRVTLTNTSDRTVRNFTRIRAFGAFVTRAGPQGQRLVLLKPDVEYETAGAGCWRAELEEFHLNRAYTDAGADVRYAAGETRATEFAVYGHPENADCCLAPGEYPIENRYDVATDDEGEEDEWQYHWGFDITVTDS